MADTEDGGAPDVQKADKAEPEEPGMHQSDVMNGEVQDGADPASAPPDADWSDNEADARDKQEAEEMAMMTQTATAALEEHLKSDQANEDDVTADEAERSAFLTMTNESKLWSDGRQGNAAGNRFPCLTPNKAHIARLPSPRGDRGQRMTASKMQMFTRALNPTKMHFPSKVTMSARAKVSTSHPSNYVFNPRRSRKVTTWDEAMSARPPLRIDMEGPTPCSYSPASKPLSETNSPKWSFGSKTFVERGGGARTSWEKTWFQSPDVWTQKADFRSDRRWPPPSQYDKQPAMGPHHPVAKAGHSHSIGQRRAFTINKKGSEAEPSPNDYNKEASDLVTKKRAPAYTHSLRRGGTLLWSVGESLENPGPGTYNPRSTYVNTHHPAFTIQGIRREKSHVLGPYATF